MLFLLFIRWNDGKVVPLHPQNYGPIMSRRYASASFVGEIVWDVTR
jgi:hypothetical protein